MLHKDVSSFFKDIELKDHDSETRSRFYGFMFRITDQLRRLRINEGLTQSDLARKVKTTQSTIARWETPGYTGYSLSKLFKISDNLKYDMKLVFVKRSIGTSTNTAEDFAKGIGRAFIKGYFNFENVNIENKGEQYDSPCVVSNFKR